MCVKACGVLCAFWICVLGELGLLLSVDSENPCLMNVLFVGVCDAQS